MFNSKNVAHTTPSEISSSQLSTWGWQWPGAGAEVTAAVAGAAIKGVEWIRPKLG
jgi:hypothetical protein